MKRLISILLLSFAAFAEDPPPQHNFLFIVDTSISMAPRKAAAIQLVGELILSGFHKQIVDGDSLDIWTFESENHIDRFPPKIWDSSRRQQLADAATQFLAQEKFQGRSRFAPVATDLQYLAPYPKALLVLLITDADEPLPGIPFETEIGERLSGNRRRIIGSKRPFLISLSAMSGAFTDWRVYHSEAKLELPELPVRKKPEPLVAKTEPASAAPAKPEPPKEPEPAPPVVINFPPGARVTAPAPEPIPPAEPVIAPVPVVTPEPEIPPEKTTVAEPPDIPKKIKSEDPVSTALTELTPEPTTVTNPTVALTGPLAPPHPVYFAIGAGLLCLMLGIALLLRRTKTREHTSLISKSLRK